MRYKLFSKTMRFVPSIKWHTLVSIEVDLFIQISLKAPTSVPQKSILARIFPYHLPNISIRETSPHSIFPPAALMHVSALSRLVKSQTLAGAAIGER